MRYAQGGGLTDAGRAARERVRLQAVERFESGQRNGEIGTALRVSERSMERWRRQWRERGEAGVLPKGCPGRPTVGSVSFHARHPA
ncbi:helix-turn-helix domain-containing protein [Streptomyces sp. NPDC127106]|uniref:helix-turn-helix domain-containing protein n=1 Tax=Streptomyces sp. NPDC127106 TaxID=3345360 RepID=UPI0036346230